MTGSAPGHTSRSEEPHCYNCGASGHWVIACPEPTRETPAGLSAWKKSANAGHGHGRGKDQHHGGSRKAKGPIITKYAPPPPPGPPPAAGVGAPGAFYPPAPGAYYPPHGPLPGPVSYPPQYPPHPHTYPPAAPSYPPPAYQPPSYSQQNFPPPVTYGSHPASQPSYPASIPPRPPPPVTLPPRYPPYPTPRSDSHSYGPPPPHPPPRPPTHPPSFTQPPTHRQPRPSYSPPGRASAPAHSTAPPPRSLPPAPLSLPEGLHHSLPPKPPKVVRDNQEPQRGNRHKRKHDRQNRHRDGRNKDMSGQRGPTKSQQPSDHQGGHRKSQASIDAPASLPHKVEMTEPRNKAQPDTSSLSSGSPKRDPAKSVKEEQQASESGQRHGAKDVDLDELEDWEWEYATIFKAAETPNWPDEVGNPLPETYVEDVLLPRKRDTKCIISKYIKPDNMEDFVKPIHETVSWLKFEFDPAFLREGLFPCGEPLAEYMEQIKSFDFGNLARPQTSREGGEDKPSKADSLSNDILDAPPQESSTPVIETTTHSDIEALDATSEQEAQTQHEELDSGMPQTSQSLPRTRIRKRSRERRRSPKTSRDSRRSSVSSQSSDLSSLEAELLGRPPKRKRQSDIPRRRRLDAHPRQQPGRWPSVASSAYSRRW